MPESKCGARGEGESGLQSCLIVVNILLLSCGKGERRTLVVLYLLDWMVFVFIVIVSVIIVIVIVVTTTAM